MQRRAGDNKVSQQVARELQEAGVANAAIAPPNCTGDCTTTVVAACCIAYGRTNNSSEIEDKRQACRNCCNVTYGSVGTHCDPGGLNFYWENCISACNGMVS